MVISLMTISGFLSGEPAPEHTLEGLEKGLEHRDVSCKLAHRRRFSTGQPCTFCSRRAKFDGSLVRATALVIVTDKVRCTAVGLLVSVLWAWPQAC